MKRIKEAEKRNLRRKKRIKSRIGLGTLNRPRVSVYKSNKYFYVQVIDDEKGNTLLSASTIEKELKLTKNIEGAKKLGEILAKRLKEKKVDNLVFDRNGYKYHGIIASFVTSLREAGINV